MNDVMQHGREPGADGGLPLAARRALVLLAAVVAGVLLLNSGLLSAGPAEDDGRPNGQGAGAEGPAVIARVGDRLVRVGRPSGSDDGALLPPGLPQRARLVPVLIGDGSSVLVGVHDGLLFRVEPVRGARWRPIGEARAVVAASTAPGRVLVRRGDDVVEVEVATGRLAQPAPFPGFDAAEGWTPQGVLSAVGTRALLMSRPAPGGALELALAWPARRVEAGTNPPVQALGRFGPLLGVAGDWVLTAAGDCPLVGCRVRIVSVTRDAVLQRDVAPPPGWAFLVGPAYGRTSGSLVPVQHLGDRSVQSVARLVAGGENALLVQGTAGVDLGAGMVSGLDGSVRLVTRFGGKPGQVRSWRPDQPAEAVAASPPDSVPRPVRLVCVCG
jgi:hypothetical protein